MLICKCGSKEFGDGYKGDKHYLYCEKCGLIREPEKKLKNGWQPIETAPKDRAMLGWQIDIGFYTFHWCKKHEDFACQWNCSLVKPTHWMPLAPAPTTDHRE